GAIDHLAHVQLLAEEAIESSGNRCWIYDVRVHFSSKCPANGVNVAFHRILRPNFDVPCCHLPADRAISSQFTRPGTCAFGTRMSHNVSNTEVAMVLL